MKALILNSGLGKRMGTITSKQPKCMIKIYDHETILSRQLQQLYECGINEIIITTGFFDKVIIDYCSSFNLPLEYTFVNNPIYDKTNYIYSIYLARSFLLDGIILLHGDLVFETSVLEDLLDKDSSCMTVSSAIPLPSKDFKVVIKNNFIEKIGVENFKNAIAAQPLYKLNGRDWGIWLNRIITYCENGQTSCYAEKAFNDISNECLIQAMDFKERLCSEVDTPDDLRSIKKVLATMKRINSKM